MYQCRKFLHDCSVERYHLFLAIPTQPTIPLAGLGQHKAGQGETLSANLKEVGRCRFELAQSVQKHSHSLSGTPASSSSSQTVAVASEGARQSPRGDSDPPEEILGPLGRAERLNWLSWKKR